MFANLVGWLVLTSIWLLLILRLKINVTVTLLQQICPLNNYQILVELLVIKGCDPYLSLIHYCHTPLIEYYGQGARWVLVKVKLESDFQA
jgi:hypothetical protein